MGVLGTAQSRDREHSALQQSAHFDCAFSVEDGVLVQAALIQAGVGTLARYRDPARTAASIN
jgi:hypothetical protein